MNGVASPEVSSSMCHECEFFELDSDEGVGLSSLSLWFLALWWLLVGCQV